jgi:hypothetical protein
MIQQAQDAGLLLEVNGGAQVLNLIDLAKTAFNDSLNTAANALSAQQQQVYPEFRVSLRIYRRTF